MLLILPTDTCYWLAWAFTQVDFDAINTLKWRDDTKRLALLIEDFDDMKNYVMISDEQIQFLKSYPYPWSFLWVRNPNFLIPDWMEASKYEKISLRVAKVCVSNYELRMKNYEYPLFLTSANLSGQPESTTLQAAQAVFPGVEGIEGEDCDQLPSDIFSIDELGNLQYLRRNYWLN